MTALEPLRLRWPALCDIGLFRLGNAADLLEAVWTNSRCGSAEPSHGLVDGAGKDRGLNKV